MARAARFAAILVLVAVSIGLIAYSVRAVRYPVSGKAANELRVTELSLTHEVSRNPDGAFSGPNSASSGGGAKACPT